MRNNEEKAMHVNLLVSLASEVWVFVCRRLPETASASDVLESDKNMVFSVFPKSENSIWH